MRPLIQDLRYALRQMRKSPGFVLVAVVAVCAIGLVGTAAAFFPGWRAAKLDPMVALRYE